MIGEIVNYSVTDLIIVSTVLPSNDEEGRRFLLSSKKDVRSVALRKGVSSEERDLILSMLGIRQES